MIRHVWQPQRRPRYCTRGSRKIAPEHFDIAEGDEAAPGAVMVINEDGAQSSCRKAYDKRVAGVISGAGEFKPGIISGSPDRPNARSPITLMGKVSCQVDAGYGPIEIGDLLTTSETSGHAMKATDATRSLRSRDRQGARFV